MNVRANTFDSLQATLKARHGDLSPQLQKIAQFVLDHPNRVALMTIAELSEELGVPPSGVIRFSKAIGYSGFTEIQKLLRGALGDMIPDSYHARIQALPHGSQLTRFARLAEASLANLPSDDTIAEAVEIMLGARMIHVVGFRRAFGIASYLTYTLSAFDAPVIQATGTGALDDAAMRLLSSEDVLIAISFPNYRTETMSIAHAAHGIGCPVIAITDSAVSPLAKLARVALLADQNTDAGFRSGAGSLVTVQALATDYGRAKQEAT